VFAQVGIASLRAARLALVVGRVFRFLKAAKIVLE